MQAFAARKETPEFFSGWIERYRMHQQPEPALEYTLAGVDHGAYRFGDPEFQTWVAARRRID